MRHAIDVSNYWLPSPVSDEEAVARMTKAKELGYSHLMAGTQIPSVCYQQLTAGLSASMTVDAYVYLTPNYEYEVSMAEWAVDELPISRLWLDAEADSLTLEQLKSAIRYAKSLGVTRLGIYTRRPWWEERGNNEVIGKRIPLWTAHYDDTPLLTPAYWRINGYGGWWKPYWKQYAQNQQIAGMNVDLNVGAV